jgi:hypothetical protein
MSNTPLPSPSNKDSHSIYVSENKGVARVWRCGHEDQEFKASPGYTVKPCLKKTKRKK